LFISNTMEIGKIVKKNCCTEQKFQKKLKIREKLRRGGYICTEHVWQNLVWRGYFMQYMHRACILEHIIHKYINTEHVF